MGNQKQKLKSEGINIGNLVPVPEFTQGGYTLWNIPRNEWEKWEASISWETIVQNVKNISPEKLEKDFKKIEAKRHLDEELEKHKNRPNPYALNIQFG